MAAVETRAPRVAHLHGGKTMCGCAAYIFTLIEAMQDSAYAPVLILINEGEVSEAAVNRGIPYLVLGKQRPCDPAGIYRLRALLQKERIDILHTHTLNGNFYGRMAALTLPSLRLVTTVHTYVERVIKDITGGRKWLGFCMLLQNRVLGLRTQAFVTASEDLRQSIIAHGVSARKTHVVYNGILPPDPAAVSGQRNAARSSFGVDDGTVVIGTAVRLVPSKNVAGLLRASASLRDGGMAHRLIIIGDGPERKRLEQISADLRLDGVCHFLGWQRDAAVKIAGFDIYVQPSFEENFPYAILEAMSAGCPVVCYRTGSHEDMVIDGQTGYVCENGDTEALAARLQQLLESSDLRAGFGRAARERVEATFTLRGMTKAMVAVYDTLLKGRK